MKWFMFQLRGVQQANGKYQYRSEFHDSEHSSPHQKIYESEEEMRGIMDRIFSTQAQKHDLEMVMTVVKNGGHQWFENDLALTEVQAASLGWIKQE